MTSHGPVQRLNQGLSCLPGTLLRLKSRPLVVSCRRRILRCLQV